MWIWAAVYFFFGFIFAILAKTAKKQALRKVSLSKIESPLPSITVIKPVRGSNKHSEKNFRSWLCQKYSAKIDYIFSFQDPLDPAIEIVKKLKSFHQNIQILINPIREGFSGKASNLFYGVQESRSEFLIFSDSDMLAEPDTVIEIVARASKSKSIVSCYPIHTESENIWSSIYSTLWNGTLVGLWAPAMIKNKSPGVAGGTVGFYKDDLLAIGGVEAFENYVAEDLKMGALFKEKGFQLELGPRIESKVGSMRFIQYWNALMRASFVSWNTESGGKFRSILFHLFAYSYSPLLIYGFFTESFSIAPLVFIFVTKSIIQSWFNYLATGKVRLFVFTLINDLMMIAALFVSMSSRRLTWAGVHYKIAQNGQMIRIS